MKSYKKFKIMGLILGVLLVVNTASAALLVEPHLGYNIHASGDNAGYDESYNGPQYGARLGYQNLGFMLGLDYTHSSGTLESKKNGSTSKEDFKSNDIGAFIGYNFPILVRAWGTYYFSNPRKFDSGTEATGNTVELGVGFTALPFLSVNVMYRIANFDEYEASNGSKTSADNTYNEIVLGVSLPLTL